jgi:hypothetical protein
VAQRASAVSRDLGVSSWIVTIYIIDLGLASKREERGKPCAFFFLPNLTREERTQTDQLHGLYVPTLDPSTDTYLVKAVREWSELIVQGASSGIRRAYTDRFATV